MRRKILLALGLGLLAAALGCHHEAGICDCEKSPSPVMHAEPPMAQGAPVMHAEPLGAPVMVGH